MASPSVRSSAGDNSADDAAPILGMPEGWLSATGGAHNATDKAKATKRVKNGERRATRDTDIIMAGRRGTTTLTALSTAAGVPDVVRFSWKRDLANGPWLTTAS